MTDTSKAVGAEVVSNKKWYVVHTYSGHERKVTDNLRRAIHAHHLEDQFGQIHLSEEDRAEMRDGKKTITRRKTFPSYVFLEMEMNEQTRNLVLNIPGVTRFVGAGEKGEKPSPLPDSEVEGILKKEDRRVRAPGAAPFKAGDHVRVIDGPFTDFTGIVDDVNADRNKVKVMVSIFGRATPVELDFLQVTHV
jgi:transcriptional antiterminator NusG